MPRLFCAKCSNVKDVIPIEYGLPGDEMMEEENTRKIPDSCVWTLEDDYFAHVPNFTGIQPCSKCGSKLVKD